MVSNQKVTAATTPVTPARLKEYTSPYKGKLILTKDLQEQIDFLHRKVGAIEWCGILFYKKIAGDLTAHEDLVLEAHHIYPMNIGSEAYTDADIEAVDVIDMYESIPDAENMRQGLIH